MPLTKTHIVASCVLAGVGDAMGYKHGEFEFNENGRDIHNTVDKLTGGKGVKSLCLSAAEFPVSDDTILLLATGEGFLRGQNFDQRCTSIAAAYLNAFESGSMEKRAPGKHTHAAVKFLAQYGTDAWKRTKFHPRGGGSGAAMRAGVLGLVLPHVSDLDDLIAYSIETGRTTHHHPMGFLGSVVVAYFTSLAMQIVPVFQWGARLLHDVMPRTITYIRTSGRDVDQNLAHTQTFVDAWTAYLKLRNVFPTSQTDFASIKFAKFPNVYGVEERDEFYRIVGDEGFPGCTGIDGPIIAYDALLGCNGDWSECCSRAALHCGDCDTTGTIAGSWFGALYGLQSVPPNHYNELELVHRLIQLGNDIHKHVESRRNSQPYPSS